MMDEKSDPGPSGDASPSTPSPNRPRNSQSAYLQRHAPVNLGMLNRNDNKGQVMGSAAKPKGLFSGGLHAAVSKKKRRFNDGNHDLDLAYITDRVIAMGFPSSGFEAKYRNSMEDTLNFFNDRHPKRFLIVNLCSEREYDHKHFTEVGGEVIRFPFDDHNCPMFDNIPYFLEQVDDFLRRDDQNVVSFHCKAGKGRTGLAICIYLLRNSWVNSAQESRQYYAMARTHNQKGVTIPSQIRYVHYYEQYMREFHENSLELPQNRTFKIRRIFVERACPSWEKIVIRTHTRDPKDGSVSYLDHKYGEDDFAKTKMMYKFSSQTCPEEVVKSSKVRRSSFGGHTRKDLAVLTRQHSRKSEEQKSWQVTLQGDAPLTLHKDVKILFKHKPLMGKASTAFGFWFNTDFLHQSHNLEFLSEKDCLYRLTLTRLQMDKVGKMKGIPDFRVEVLFDLVDGAASPRPTVSDDRRRDGDMQESVGGDDVMDPGELATRRDAVGTNLRKSVKAQKIFGVQKQMGRQQKGMAGASLNAMMIGDPVSATTESAQSAQSAPVVGSQSLLVDVTDQATKFLEATLQREYSGSRFTATDAVAIVTGLRSPVELAQLGRVDTTNPMGEAEAMEACKQLVEAGAILPANAHTDIFDTASPELWEMRST